MGYEKICLVCNEQCSYQAVVGDEKKRPLLKRKSALAAGICENKCPVDGDSAIIVYSSGIQKKLKPERIPPQIPPRVRKVVPTLESSVFGCRRYADPSFPSLPFYCKMIS